MGQTRYRRDINVQLWIMLPLELQPPCAQIKKDQLVHALIMKQHRKQFLGLVTSHHKDSYITKCKIGPRVKPRLFDHTASAITLL